MKKLCLVLIFPLFIGLFLAACDSVSPENDPPEPNRPVADVPGEEPDLVPGDLTNPIIRPPFLSVLKMHGLVTGDAAVAPTDMACDGSSTVTLELEGETSIQDNPVQVMLVLDRSGSMGMMGGTPLANLKTAANTFVDILDEASDGALDGSFGVSKVGVVSFAGSASLNQGLTSDANVVKSAVNALSAGGMTAAGDGINLAQAQYTGTPPTPPHVMIIVTDGNSNQGADPSTAASNARAVGTEIFAIGFGSVNFSSIQDWATDPDDKHAFDAPSSSDLPDIFAGIGEQIVNAAGTNIEVQATVTDHFSVTINSSPPPNPTKGTAGVAGNVVTWTIDVLAEKMPETAELTYTITHDPDKTGGVEDVHVSITYTDDEGNTPTFPDLQVNVRGCPAFIDLEPDTETNELGTPGQTHTVTATVTDDFGDPVESVDVDFDVLSGPNAGENGAGTTDGSGETDFTYTATQGLAGLGQDNIQGCYTVNVGACDDVLKDWVDTTPPYVACEQGVNPAGRVPPPNNEDGFFELVTTDAVDPDPQVFVDAGSGVIFGGFPNGTNVKYTEAPGAVPKIKAGPGQVDWRITGNQDMVLFAVDASGNQSDPLTCLVPPPPK